MTTQATVAHPPAPGQAPIWAARLSSPIDQGPGAVSRPGGLDCGGGSIYGTMML